MIIVFVVENFYPENAGVPVVARYLAEGLANSYNYTIYAVTKRGDEEATGSYKGIQIYRFSVEYSNGFTISGDREGFYNKVVELKPDILIMECAQCVTTDIMLPYLHELKCKKILHSHDFSGLWFPFIKIYPSLRSTIGSPKNYIQWRFYYYNFFKKFIDDFDLLLYISPLGKDKKYFEKNAHVRYELLQNAANDMFFSCDTDKEKKSTIALNKYCSLQSEKYYICLCNYSGIKNQKKVLEEYYKTNRKDIAMVFAGSKENNYLVSLKKYERKLILKYGKREVHYLTGISRTDIPSILAHAQLSLTASLWEAYSIALIETMAVGTPFVSTDVGNARLLPGGITIKKVSDMHNVIDRIMEDTSLLTQLSDQGKKYANENCRKDIVVSRLNDLIVSLFE